MSSGVCQVLFNPSFWLVRRCLTRHTLTSARCLCHQYPEIDWAIFSLQQVPSTEHQITCTYITCDRYISEIYQIWIRPDVGYSFDPPNVWHENLDPNTIRNWPFHLWSRGRSKENPCYFVHTLDTVYRLWYESISKRSKTPCINTISILYIYISTAILSYVRV